jgi:hypothetical protein
MAGGREIWRFGSGIWLGGGSIELISLVGVYTVFAFITGFFDIVQLN